MDTVLPSDIRYHYPFASRRFQLSSGHHLHYIDEGYGPVLLMLHGNPTWSFMYRNVIKELKKEYRCIALDNLGCGLSDKPQNIKYTLRSHINNAIEFVRDMGIESFNLLVHDWGGPIGFGLAQHMPERLEKLIITNTAGFLSKDIPFSINLCRLPLFGSLAIRGFNAFAEKATTMAVKKPLDPVIKKGYCYPYNNWGNRIATLRFVQDIPMHKWHPSYETLKKIESQLEIFNSPSTLLCWGMKDFCFTPKFLKTFKQKLPQAQAIEFSDAGHYLFEDDTENVINALHKFLSVSCYHSSQSLV